MKSISIQAFAAGLVAIFVIGAAAPAPAAAVSLAPHRAVYDLSLKSRDTNTSIVSVRGRMVHEFTGTPCEGYTVSMRWIAEMGDSKGDVDIDDIRFASFEDTRTGLYSYTSVRRMNDTVIEEVKAHAEREGTGGQVKLSKPTTETFDLPGEAVFPSEHLAAILQGAMDDERIAEKRVYDVSDTGKKIYQTLAVIGAARDGETPGGLETGPVTDELGRMRMWRVTVSYFEGDGTGDETPAFAQSFDLYENGVAADLVLDYGEMVITGALTDLEFLSADECPDEAGRP